MGDVAKFFGNAVRNIGEFERNAYSHFGNAAKAITGSSGFAGNISDFFERELMNKSDLRGAQTETFLSGLPIVGSMLRGVEGVNQLEDLYNNTGKVPAYPANQVSGASGVGSGIATLARIADGTHDLYEFYSGSPDQFRQEMNMTYQ